MEELKEVIDSALAMIAEHELEVSILQSKIANLEGKNDYLIGELQCCRRSFTHHGLEGHAWIAQQAIIIGRKL